jgi:hypothetical protein
MHEGVKGVDVCAHTTNLVVKAKFEKEHNDAQRLKGWRIKFARNTRLAVSSEPTIVHKARKRSVM